MRITRAHNADDIVWKVYLDFDELCNYVKEGEFEIL